MKSPSIILSILGLAFLTLSCQQKLSDLNEAQKTLIIDSATAVVKKVFEYSNKLEYKTALKFYSEDADVRFVDNGTILTFADLKTAYDQVGPTMELVENNVERWDAVILGPEAVSFTLPIQLRLKPKDRPEYKGQFVWSGIVQKRNGKWLIVQSHESWLNYAEAIAALTQPVSK